MRGQIEGIERTDMGLRASAHLENVPPLPLSNPHPLPLFFVSPIGERAQRHFATFACMMPSKGDLKTIYASLLGGHLTGFPAKVGPSLFPPPHVQV